MRSKKHREPPEFETIQAAIEGDAEAAERLLRGADVKLLEINKLS